MTREHKLALIVGFSLVLVLGVLISDHFSKARSSPLAVEIKEGPSTPFGSGAVASSYTPASALPNMQPPVPSRGAVGPSMAPDLSPKKPLPGTGPGAASPFEMAMGIPDAPLPITTLSKITEGPIDVQPGASPGDGHLPISAGVLKRYTVRENDNIYSIARKHYGNGNLWTQLRDFNKGKVSESGGMREGVTLEIPPRDVLEGKARLGDPRVASGEGATAKSEAGAEGARYLVQEGDTLFSIARKRLGSGRRVQEIIDANPGLDSPDELRVGSALRLPAR